MSLCPFVFGDDCLPAYRHRYWPHRLLDPDYGWAFTPDAILSSIVSPQLKQLALASDSNIKVDKDKFQINVDVQHFQPDEITVRTADGHVVIEGRHEEKRDAHGFVSRQFSRRFALPKGVTENVEARISSDGVLTITAPRSPSISNERIVPISRTGPVRKEITDACERSDASPSDESEADKGTKKAEVKEAIKEK